MLKLKTLKSAENIYGKKVLLRCDYNVPQDDNLNITDNSRIVESIPTIKFLLEHDCKIIIMSHLGRPKGKVVEKLRLTSVGKELSKLLGKNIKKLDDNVGEEIKKSISEMKEKDIILLENIQFNPKETENDLEFAKELASYADIFVSDVFGQIHRDYTSVSKITDVMDSYAGFLVEKELTELSKLNEPNRPYIAILGGAKVSDKIDLIEQMLKKVDKILIGGAMIFTFYKARGYEIGKSLVENDKLDLAKELLSKAGSKIILPIDIVIANDKNESATDVKTVSFKEIPNDYYGLDIGRKTIDLYISELSKANTIFWNGPMGLFEIPKFAIGTNDIAKFLADSNAIRIVGGGDSASAVRLLSLENKFTHISTGGGASLEYLEGKTLPGLRNLIIN